MFWQWTAVREEWIISQWLSLILGKNIGQAGDGTSNLLSSIRNATDWAMGLGLLEKGIVLKLTVTQSVMIYDRLYLSHCWKIKFKLQLYILFLDIDITYSGILLVQSARDRDFLYRLNIVRTKKCDCVRIVSLPYADLFDWIDIACLTVPSIWGFVPWIFSNIYHAKSQIQCSRYTWWFLRK